MATKYNQISDYFEITIKPSASDGHFYPTFQAYKCKLCGWEFQQQISGLYSSDQLSFGTQAKLRMVEHLNVRHEKNIPMSTIPLLTMTQAPFH